MPAGPPPTMIAFLFTETESVCNGSSLVERATDMRTSSFAFSVATALSFE